MTRTLEIRWFWNRVVQCAPGSARNAEDVPTRRPPVPPVAKLSGRVDDRSEAANIAQARRAEPEALVGDRRSRAGPGSETRAHCRIGVKSALANALDPCWMRHAGSDAACFSRLLERSIPEEVGMSRPAGIVEFTPSPQHFGVVNRRTRSSSMAHRSRVGSHRHPDSC
jgi:hypothetical protein